MAEERAWYKTGFEAAKDVQHRQQVQRFWLPKGGAKHVLFLDEDLFCFWEHNVYMNGSWRNHFTCTADIEGTCPLCEAHQKAYFVGMLSVVDIDGFTDRQNRQIKNLPKVYGAKLDTIERLQLYKGRKGLKNCVYLITRTGNDPQSPNVGNDFEYIEGPVSDLAKFVNHRGEEPKPFNYRELFAPLSPEQLKRIALSVGGPVPPEGTDAPPPDEGETVAYQ